MTARGDPGDRLEHVDAREVPGGGEPAGQHDVAVEDRAGGVGDRLVVVVALDEHGVEAGDAARAARCRRARAAGAAARRRTAGSRGSPGGSPADRPISRWAMATRVRLSIISTTCRPLSRNHSAIRVATNAARSRTSGGCVGGGDDDDRAGQALGAEVVLEELADLAATLADQRDHGDLGVGAAGDHRQQAGLADAGAGEDAEALAAAARRQRVEGADAERRAAGRSAGGCRAAGGALSTTTCGEVGRAAGPPSIGRPRPSSTRPRSSSPTAIRRPSAGGLARGRRRAGRCVAPSGRQVSTPRVAGDDLGGHGAGAAADLEQVAERGGDAGDGDAEAEQAGDATEVRRRDGDAGAARARSAVRALIESASRSRSRALGRSAGRWRWSSVSATASRAVERGVGDDVDAVLRELGDGVADAAARRVQAHRASSASLGQHGEHPGDDAGAGVRRDRELVADAGSRVSSKASSVAWSAPRGAATSATAPLSAAAAAVSAGDGRVVLARREPRSRSAVAARRRRPRLGGRTAQPAWWPSAQPTA